ncbi:MAG: response regulator transcription factor [Clostridiaceae bacterium]|nr:response regulator transcription factor [Clostridiaceae bacterium]
MKIIIIDDDIFVSKSLKIILEADGDLEICATGHSGAEAIGLFEKHMPDVMLMDIRMDNLNGLDAAKEIISKFPQAKILLLTTFADDEYIVKAINIGAKGYILKQDFESVAPAIKAVESGQTVFGNEIMDKIPSLIQSKTSIDHSSIGLSDKEFEIVRLIADGLNNKEIAASLYLSEGTVRNYISNILMKLSLRDRTQLACFYYKLLI